MKERPIIFSTADVCAILDGRKTQTRRVVKPQPDPSWTHNFLERLSHKMPVDDMIAGTVFEDPLSRCPYGTVGDRLWVRETWCQEWDGERPMEGRYLYAATDSTPQAVDDDGWARFRKDGSEASPWRPSIHMPQWASRITLEITGVRVERVQDITDEDAKAEGAKEESGYVGDDLSGMIDCDHRIGFRNLWNSTNAARGFGWDANPWVWVIEFRRIDN